MFSFIPNRPQRICLWIGAAACYLAALQRFAKMLDYYDLSDAPSPIWLLLFGVGLSVIALNRGVDE